MHKLTALFSFLIVALLLGLVFTWWQLFGVPGNVRALGNVAGLRLGLAGDGKTSANISFEASSAVLWDIEEKRLRYEQNGYERRPIASLTKLMTAMVAIDQGINWDKEMTIERDEYGLGGNLFLHFGEKVTMRDLFYASLVGSANNATLALVRGMEIPEVDFVIEMNRKAVELDLEQTVFTDVTGLDPENVGTAYEVVRMAEEAFTQYPEIIDAASKSEHTIDIQGSGRQHTMRNSNKLISRDGEETSGTKTGYLDEARWCLVMKGVGDLSNRIAVILGHPNEQRHFSDTKRLLELAVP